MENLGFRQLNFKSMVQKFNDCFLFGAGYYANVLLDYYGEIVSKCISGIIVSDKTNNPSFIQNIPVYALAEVHFHERDLVILSLKDDEDAFYAISAAGCKNVIRLWQVLPIEDEQKMAIEKKRDYEVRKYIDYFHTNNPLFKYIEIETLNRCNGICSFCPVNAKEVQRPYKKMSKELFFSIINQLHELNYQGLVALFSNNEAFLDERISEFAKYAKTKLPNALIYIISNGTLLTVEKFLDIIPYLDRLQIDNYLTSEMPNNIVEIIKKAKEKGIENKIIYYNIPYDTVRQSRGGSSPNGKIYYTMEVLCPLPFVQMVIRPDGKVSLCCNDSLGANTLGDVTHDKILDIWTNPSFRDIRKRISDGRHMIETCRYCNHFDCRELYEVGMLEPKRPWGIIPPSIPKEKECIIWGIGEMAIDFCGYLLSNGYSVYCFASNGYHGMRHSIIAYGVECKNINDLKEKTSLCVYIAMTHGIYEIYDELLEYGFFDIRVVFCDKE